MALSWNFFPDRDTIIKAALRRIRAYDPEDATTIATVQYTNAAETLNFLLSSWQALGVPIWCIKQVTKTLTASDGDYTIGTSGADITGDRPLSVVQAWLRDTDSIDHPLEIISRQEYNDLTNKGTTGKPVFLYFDATYGVANTGANSTSIIYLWPEPDTTAATEYTLYLQYQRPLLNFGAATDLLDMPQEWYEAVRLNLAYKIAPEYGMQASDYDRLKIEADKALEIAFGWDNENNSIYLQPNNDS